MKGFNPQGVRDRSLELSVKREEPTRVLREFFLVCFIFMLLRLAMLSSGITFMNIPLIDGFLKNVVAFFK